MAKETTTKQLYDLVNKKFEVVFAQLQSIQTDIRQLQKTQKEHTERFDEIDEMLGVLSRAVDKDAVMIIEYGRRLTRLERSR